MKQILVKVVAALRVVVGDDWAFDDCGTSPNSSRRTCPPRRSRLTYLFVKEDGEGESPSAAAP